MEAMIVWDRERMKLELMESEECTKGRGYAILLQGEKDESDACFYLRCLRYTEENGFQLETGANTFSSFPPHVESWDRVYLRERSYSKRGLEDGEEKALYVLKGDKGHHGVWVKHLEWLDEPYVIMKQSGGGSFRCLRSFKTKGAALNGLIDFVYQERLRSLLRGAL